MKAVVIHKHGGAGQLKYEEVRDPVLSSGEVLVQVKACAINHLDLWTRMGIPGASIPLPHILGCDVAGVVKDWGDGVAHLTRNATCLIAPGISCGRCEMCVSARDSQCASYQILGFQVDGGYAEFVKVPVQNVLPLPEGLSFVEAAAVPLVFLTAWHMLMTRGALRAGETVLVHAAGSGIGSAAIQIAKLAGATVITTVGKDAKIPKAKRLGADEVINYRKADFAERVKQITQGRGADVVFEHIGPATWPGNLKALAKGGRMVVCGATSGPEVKMPVRYLYAKELQISGCYMGSHKELLEVLRLIERKRLKPVVDRTYPLRQAAKAHEKIEGRDIFGKVVLVP